MTAATLDDTTALLSDARRMATTVGTWSADQVYLDLYASGAHGDEGNVEIGLAMMEDRFRRTFREQFVKVRWLAGDEGLDWLVDAAMEALETRLDWHRRVARRYGG